MYILTYVLFTLFRSCIQRVVDSAYTFSTVYIPYPEQLLSAADFPDLLQPHGAVLDILEVIGEFLLSITVEDLCLRPEIMFNEKTGEREISTYATSKEFEKICHVISEEYGDDVYPLIVQFNGDGMPVDGLGKPMLA